VQLTRLATLHQKFSFKTITLNLLDDPQLATAFAVSLRTSFAQLPHAIADPVGANSVCACVPVCASDFSPSLPDFMTQSTPFEWPPYAHFWVCSAHTQPRYWHGTHTHLRSLCTMLTSLVFNPSLDVPPLNPA
jgi:hypothetical protein